MSVWLFEAGGGWHERMRWGIAALIVLVAHAAGAWMLARQQPAVSAGEMPAAIMMELAPLPVAPATEPADVAPGPEVREIQPEPEPEPEPETQEPEVAMPSPPEPAEPSFETAELQPPPIPAPKPEVALPEPPKKKPVMEPPKPEAKKKRAPRPQPLDERQGRKKPKPQSTAATAPPRLQAAAAPAAPALGAAPSSTTSPANWRGALLARLNRAKRYPSEARQRREEGTVRLSFSIDRSGRVVSYRIAGSSGFATLDQEALAMIQRASPLPAPPPEVGGARISLTVPVHFKVN